MCIALRTIHFPLFHYPLLADIELLNERAVFGDVLLGEVIEQAPALADHHEQAAAAVMILGIFLEVRGEGIDLLGEDGDLYFRAPRVVRRFAELRSKLLLCFFCNWHQYLKIAPLKNAAETSRYKRPGSHVPRMGTGFEFRTLGNGERWGLIPTDYSMYHEYLTHFAISLNLNFLPYMRIPTR